MLFTWNCWSSTLLLFHLFAKFLRNHSYCILLPPLPLQGQFFPDQGKQWVCTASSPDIVKCCFVDLSCQLTQMILLRDLGWFKNVHLPLVTTEYKMLQNINIAIHSLFFSTVFFQTQLHHHHRQDFSDHKEKSATWLLYLNQSPWPCLQTQNYFQGIFHLILKQMRWTMPLSTFFPFTVAWALLRGRQRHYKLGDRWLFSICLYWTEKIQQTRLIFASNFASVTSVL